MLLLVLAAASTFAAVKTIADFGGKADGVFDNGPALQKAFTYAASHPGTILKLGGVCRIATPQSNEGKSLYAAGGEYITNLTIEDGEIILGGAFSALTFAHSPGLTIRNVVFDYDPPIQSQGTITAMNRGEKSITVVPDKGFPAPMGSGFKDRDGNWMTVHKPDGEYAFFFVGFIQSSAELGDGRYKLMYDRPDMAAVIDGMEGLRYVRVRRGLGHLNVFNFCDRLTMERCSIHSASAFASLIMFCNDVSLVSNRICPREGSAAITATCADGFHFIGARRGPRIEHNLFDRLQDDNIVISLRGNRIVSYDGAKIQLTAASVTWYEKGDTLEVVDGFTGSRREYTIAAMEPYRWPWQPPLITLDRPIEGKIIITNYNDRENNPTMVFNKSWRLDGTLIRGNRFQNTRRYAVFMGAGGVRIEDNIMSNHTSAAIMLSHIETLKNAPNGLIYYFSRDVSVERNTIVNAVNYGIGAKKFQKPEGAIDMYFVDRVHAGIGEAIIAENIIIRDNRIVSPGAEAITVPNAKNVTITGNTIISPGARKGESAPIQTPFTSGGVLSGNTIQR